MNDIQRKRLNRQVTQAKRQVMISHLYSAMVYLTAFAKAYRDLYGEKLSSSALQEGCQQLKDLMEAEKKKLQVRRIR